MNDFGASDFSLNGENFKIINEFSNDKYIAVANETLSPSNYFESFMNIQNFSKLPEGGLLFSSWNPYRLEYGWPPGAFFCSCIRSSAFSRFISQLHKESFISTPWPTSNALHVEKKTFTRLISNSRQIGFPQWIEAFPLGSHYICLSALNVNSPQDFVNLDGPGIHKNWVSKQLSNFTGGIIPREIGENTRKAWIENRAAELGLTYLNEGKQTKVHRRITSLRGIRIEDKFCCSTISYLEPTLFLTQKESLAMSTVI